MFDNDNKNSTEVCQLNDVMCLKKDKYKISKVKP